MSNKNIKEDFKGLEKAYHYTSYQTALKILESKALRYGRLSAMNDIHENDKLFCTDWEGPIGRNKFSPEILDELEQEVYRYRQISFSIDTDSKKGFDLHQMWGMYADKGNGVCLVFDKEMLEKEVADNSVRINEVSYNQNVDSSVFSKAGVLSDVPKEIREKANDIFFCKREEWEHEQEWRILKYCSNFHREEYLQIEKSLKYVIMTSRLQGIDCIAYKQKIEEIKKYGIPILIYGNSLFDYSLDDWKGSSTIWESNNGYDIPILSENCKLDLERI